MMDIKETETIDKLFLELSQFTKSTTAKELQLEADKARLVEALEYAESLKLFDDDFIKSLKFSNRLALNKLKEALSEMKGK